MALVVAGSSILLLRVSHDASNRHPHWPPLPHLRCRSAHHGHRRGMGHLHPFGLAAGAHRRSLREPSPQGSAHLPLPLHHHRLRSHQRFPRHTVAADVAVPYQRAARTSGVLRCYDYRGRGGPYLGCRRHQVRFCRQCRGCHRRPLRLALRHPHLQWHYQSLPAGQHDM